MCIICDTCDSTTSLSLSDVVFLDCSDCPVVQALPLNMPNLKFLCVYDTNITEIPHYPSLEALYCFNTQIEYLPSLPKLRKLVAHDTKLKKINDDLYRCEIIDICNTQVSEIPTTLISLKELKADDTLITAIPDKLISLESLSIQRTDISELPDSMPSLVYLNCSDTKINDINEDKYVSLRKLHCTNCHIDPFQFKNRVDVFM